MLVGRILLRSILIKFALHSYIDSQRIERNKNDLRNYRNI